jgi:DNA repair protein RecO (recombination protein O)
MLEKREGIVLRSTDCKDRQRILTVFTEESGLIQIIVKHLSKKNPGLFLLTTPFCLSEFVYFKGRSEMFRFDSGSVLKEYFSEQKEWLRMEALGHLGKAILSSQLPGKPAPLLFALFKSYLEKLSQVEDPHSLCTSFYLKTLKHEGLITLEKLCQLCQKYEAQCLHQGQSYCLKDAPCKSTVFSVEEWQHLFQLLHARSFQNLSCSANVSLLEKTADYFRNAMRT